MLNEFRLAISVLDQVCRLLGELGQGTALQQHRFQIAFSEGQRYRPARRPTLRAVPVKDRRDPGSEPHSDLRVCAGMPLSEDLRRMRLWERCVDT